MFRLETIIVSRQDMSNRETRGPLELDHAAFRHTAMHVWCYIFSSGALIFAFRTLIMSCLTP
ncbi:hypothetical protein P692DRAFT_20159753 [Suillus brevipes Sb2]|nr:hypothetical protein P692DRAFT_20159753 [Suillus brevipes Sb2]